VLHDEEQEAHVEQAAHVEQEAPEEEDGGVGRATVRRRRVQDRGGQHQVNYMLVEF
jgi:hypothetical protein